VWSALHALHLATARLDQASLLHRDLEGQPFLRYRASYIVDPTDDGGALAALTAAVEDPANHVVAALQADEVLLHYNGFPHGRKVATGAQRYADGSQRKLIRCRVQPVGAPPAPPAALSAAPPAIGWPGKASAADQRVERAFSFLSQRGGAFGRAVRAKHASLQIGDGGSRQLAALASSQALMSLLYMHSLASLHCASANFLRGAARAAGLTRARASFDLTYDLVIIGAGLHEQIVQNVLRSLEAHEMGHSGSQLSHPSHLRTLTVEQSTLVSAALALDPSEANSSTRHEQPGATKGSAGGASSHVFPQAALPASQAGHVVTPPLRELAQVAAINRAMSCHRPVCFGHKVTSIRAETHASATPTDGGGRDDGVPPDAAVLAPLKPHRYVLTLQSEVDGSLLEVGARCVLDCRGIGEPTFPAVPLTLRHHALAAAAGSTSTGGAGGELALLALQQKQSFINDVLSDGGGPPSVRAASSFPSVLHSRDMHTLLAMLANPMHPFLHQRVAVVGCGDAGKCCVEFLLRHVRASPSCYGHDDIAVGGAPHIVWVGQRGETAAEFKQVGSAGGRRVRARYHRIGRHIDKGDVRAVPGHVVRAAIGGRSIELHVSNGRSGEAASAPLVLEVDRVIFATGLAPDLELYRSLVPCAAARSSMLCDGVERISTTPADTLPSATTTASSLRHVPTKQLRGHNVFFCGPAGGDFFGRGVDSGEADLLDLGVDATLLRRATDIPENRATIFALEAITEATARLVHRALQPLLARGGTAPPVRESAQVTELVWRTKNAESQEVALPNRAAAATTAATATATAAAATSTTRTVALWPPEGAEERVYAPLSAALSQLLGGSAGGSTSCAELCMLRLLEHLVPSRAPESPCSVLCTLGGGALVDDAQGNSTRQQLSITFDSADGMLDAVSCRALEERLRADTVLLIVLRVLHRDERRVHAIVALDPSVDGGVSIGDCSAYETRAAAGVFEQRGCKRIRS
jgi:hypothetical protein